MAVEALPRSCGSPRGSALGAALGEMISLRLAGVRVSCQRLRHSSQEIRIREVIRKQMYVRRERERGRVMAQPDLRLLGVQAVAEERRRARMAQRVQAGPRHA